MGEAKLQNICWLLGEGISGTRAGEGLDLTKPSICTSRGNAGRLRVVCSQALPPSVPAPSLGHLPPPGTEYSFSLPTSPCVPPTSGPLGGVVTFRTRASRARPWLSGARPEPQLRPLDSSPGLDEELNSYVSVWV